MLKLRLTFREKLWITLGYTVNAKVSSIRTEIGARVIFQKSVMILEEGLVGTM